MSLDPPDAHLRQALRHAPDARLQAPAELGAQILAAAHRATTDAPPPPAASPRPWWPWRTSWRLGASGAFASVLMAGVIGLLWRGEPPGPAHEDPAAAAAPPWAVPPASAAVAETLRQSAPAVPAPAALPAIASTLPSPAPAASYRLAEAGLGPDAAASARSDVDRPPLPWADAAAGGALPTLMRRGTAHVVGAAWLDELATHTAGRWRPDDLARAQEGDVLVEWRLGQRAMDRLWLGRQGALWCPPPGSTGACRTALLSTETAQDLKEKLPR